MASIISGFSVAGPNVATMRVRRSMIMPSVCSAPVVLDARMIVWDIAHCTIACLFQFSQASTHEISGKTLAFVSRPFGLGWLFSVHVSLFLCLGSGDFYLVCRCVIGFLCAGVCQVVDLFLFTMDRLCSNALDSVLLDVGLPHVLAALAAGIPLFPRLVTRAGRESYASAEWIWLRNPVFSFIHPYMDNGRC